MIEFTARVCCESFIREEIVEDMWWITVREKSSGKEVFWSMPWKTPKPARRIIDKMAKIGGIQILPERTTYT